MKLKVPCDATAPRRVRRALGAVEDLAPVRDEALLVASELVTNAVLHSGCRADDWLDVEVDRDGEAVLICVADPGASSGEVRPREDPRPDRAGGWGLTLVSRLARRWGAERDGGQRVWAELRLGA